jgi:hypothetical protein
MLLYIAKCLLALPNSPSECENTMNEIVHYLNEASIMFKNIEAIGPLIEIYYLKVFFRICLSTDLTSDFSYICIINFQSRLLHVINPRSLDARSSLKAFNALQRLQRDLHNSTEGLQTLRFLSTSDSLRNFLVYKPINNNRIFK